MADETNLNEELGDRIIPINIEDEMKTAYIDYSMSVIVSRALPDVRDGLKPVHRRVLYGMSELGLASNRPYKKSARIVGEVLGKYHPHGDSSVYDTMVRMAQDWSLRYPFVDGQGNFGSMDGDPPAAMRYTEARMRKIAEEMMTDIEKNTVDFRGNFDDSLEEPTVMPAKVPNLLINGASGIAVGMATNMAPHNLSEVVDGIKAYIDNNDIETEELMTHIKGPDFPTGGTIYGFDGIKDAYETGRGRVVVRGKVEFEVTKTGREQIIITEIPYQVNPSNLIIKAAELVNEKVIEGVSDIRDESSRHGLRVVFDLKKDAIPNIILNQLYKYTQLQTSFSINSIALVKGRPMMLTLKDMIHHFVDHRHEVIVRRTQFDLDEAKKRAHILEGLLIALDHLDEVIALIRKSQTPDEAKEGLMGNFGLTEIQAKAILEMRLQRLTGLERDKIRLEYDDLMKFILDMEDILANQPRRMQIIKDELDEMKQKFGDKRRTDIVHTSDDISIEDMIPDENVVITISHLGYIKRTALTEYRTQKRGGRGNKGATARDADFVEHLFIASTHNYMLFFTEQGKCFWMKVYEIPEGARATKGRAIQNLINIAPDDKIRAFINVDNLKDEDYLKNNAIIMCTKNGIIKKTTLEAYSRPRQNGINAVTVRDGDVLLEAQLTTEGSEILIAKKSGKAIRFSAGAIRPMGRTASGVKGVTLDGPKDEVIGMICVNPSNRDTTILVVSEKGFGKRTYLKDPESGEDVYRVTGRGGKGVKTLNVTDKTGALIAIKDVNEDNDVMIILKSGIAIRMSMDALRVTGRATQGVRLIKMGKNDEIASVAVVEHEDEVEEAELDQNGVVAEGNESIILDTLGDDTSGEDEGPEADATDDEDDN